MTTKLEMYRNWTQTWIWEVSSFTTGKRRAIFWFITNHWDDDDNLFEKKNERLMMTALVHMI